MEIADFPAFASLNSTQIENFRGACVVENVPARTEIIRRGDDGGGNLYFLLEGELQVFVPRGGREVELVRLSAPAVVGELELLTGSPRTASVRTLTDARIMSIDHKSVQERIDDGDPAVLKVMFTISRLIAGRLASMTEKFVEIEASSDPSRSVELREFRKKIFGEWSFDRVG